MYSKVKDNKMDKPTGNSDEKAEGVSAERGVENNQPLDDDSIMEVFDLGITRKRGIKTVDLTDSDGDEPSKDSMAGVENEPSDDGMGVTKAIEESTDERVVKNVEPEAEANLIYSMSDHCKRTSMVFLEMVAAISNQELWIRSRPLLFRMFDVSFCFVLILLQSLQFLAMGLHMALRSLEFALGLIKVLLGGLIATVSVVRLASRPRTKDS